MRARALLLTALAATAVALGACGEEEPASGGQAGGTAPPAAERPAPQGVGVTGIVTAISEDLQERPQIPQPTEPPPTELVTRDVVEGDGRVAQDGDRLSVQYVGASWSTGQEFDASYERGEPFTFELGGGMVIPGWDEGLEGMRVGGRRVLVIPPELGYGPQGSPPAIAPNESLVFVIDLKRVRG